MGGFANELIIFAGWSFAIMAFIIWSLVWKGMALWKSARDDSRVWFVVFLVIHTAGILEILYIYFFSKMSKDIRHKNYPEICS